MRTILVTVGTSLLTNGGWHRDQDLPTLAVATEWASTNPVRAAAETNTLSRLPLRETNVDRLAWLHSDTSEGQLCAEALQASYASQGYTSSLHRITGLGYNEATFAERGLRTLLAEAFAVIDSAGSTDAVTICATGGFKAEIAYLNLLGLLLGIDVYYIHEQFRELVSLPRLPLDWNLDWVNENEIFFHWIDEEPRRTEDVENWLHGRPVLRQLVADAADGHSYLTPVGDLLYRVYRQRSARAPRATWPLASEAAPHAKKKDILSAKPHHRPEGWQRYVERLAEIDCVSAIGYDGAHTGIGGTLPRVLAGPSGVGRLYVVIGKDGTELSLRVQTTAMNDEQLGLVRTWIERNIKKW